MSGFDDEPRFETVWAPDDWPWTTDGAVRYVPARLEDALLGYLWASEMDDAAGFVPAAPAGAAGDNADVAWTDRLREAKASGLTPLAALRHWAGRPADDRCGAVPAAAELRAGSLAEVQRLAEHDM